MIERLRSSQESSEDKYREEVEDLKKAKRALEKRLEGLQKGLAEKEVCLTRNNLLFRSFPDAETVKHGQKLGAFCLGVL